MPEFNPEMPGTAGAGSTGARDLTAAASGGWQDASGAWRRSADYIKREIEQRPFRTALVSVGAGYLLGGGLFTALTAKLVGTGLRLALRGLAFPAIATGAVSLGKQFLSENENRTSRFD